MRTSLGSSGSITTIRLVPRARLFKIERRAKVAFLECSILHRRRTPRVYGQALGRGQRRVPSAMLTLPHERSGVLVGSRTGAMPEIG
jgi:hypothetical protein